jgi:toxin ParE1/3/4
MSKNYRISEKAISDLESIWLYTLKKWSKAQADRYHYLILREIEYIAENFELARKVDHIRLGYRVSKVKSHLIFCRRSESSIVEIVRILHQGMDVEERLKAEGKEGG